MKRTTLVLVIAVLSITFFYASYVQAKSGEKVVTLKFAHQWPQNPKDPLIATALKFTKEVTAKTNGKVQFRFFPAQSLVKAKSTYEGLQKGTVDLSILPYIYAAGIVPQLKFSMFECIFENHDAWFAWRKTKGYDLLEKKNNEGGVKSLVWLQSLVGLLGKGKYIATPADAKGVKARVPGPYLEALLSAAGAGLASMTSSEVYMAAQRGMLECTATSSASMAGFKLFEVFDHLLSPIGPSLSTVLEPICISMKTWNEKLNDEQRKVMIEVGKECEFFGLEKVKAYDESVANMFREKGCSVRVMTESEYEEWRKLARKAVHPKKRKEVPDADFFYKDLETLGYKF